MKKYVLKLCGCFFLYVRNFYFFLELNGIEICYIENIIVYYYNLIL